MRVRGCAGSISHIEEDSSQCFLLRRVLLYVDRLLAHYHKLDYEILEAIHWLLGNEIVEGDILTLVSMLPSEQRRRQEMDISEEIRNGRDFAHLVESALRRCTTNEQLVVIDLLRGLLKKRLDALVHSGESDIEKNLTVFRQMFDLNDVETEICLFLFITSVYEESESLFLYHLKCSSFAGRNFLAAMLGSTGQEIGDALGGKLAKIGILDSDRHRSLSMDSGFVNLLQNPSDADITTEFFRRIDPDPIGLEAHTVKPRIIEHVLDLFRAKPQSSTHVVFYGPPGTGKTSMAQAIGKKLGLPIYLVEHGGKEKSWKRQAAFTACVNVSSQGEGALIIADDTDNVLGTRHSWFFFGETSDKRWLHDILEVPGVRMIWTVNSISQIEESVVRRFSFSLGFKPFTIMQRKRIWEAILTDYRLNSYFETTEIERLASQFDVSAGVIEQTVEKAWEIGSDSKDEIYNAIVLSLEAHDSLANGGNRNVRTGKIDSHSVSLEGLNVSGVDLPGLLKELETFDHFLKANARDEAVSMSLLFYGVSGAGKSFLARYIAQNLGKEVVYKRASDILSKWVGESEQNVRACFDEAVRKDAVLLVDELDSIIGSRDRATRTGEVSLVNEFLTSMESHRGIQIYTTNRLMDLDHAALRRFNYKIEFGHLKPDGVVIFYKKILQPLVRTCLQKELEDELRGIYGLTPGDMNVVKSRFQFKPSDHVSNEAMIEALREEARVKEIHSGKKAIGF